MYSTEPKILIADDEPLNLMLYSEMVRPIVSTILTANNGDEAVKIATKEYPDIIVLDWNMPVLDGLEALRIIKSQPAFNNTPVIMITGIMTSAENLKMALESGAVDFIRKPFDKIELQARMKSVLMVANYIKDLDEKYKTIQKNNKFIGTLVEGIPHPMVYYSLNGIIQVYNKKFETVFGKGIEKIEGNSIYSHILNIGTPTHQQRDKDLINSKKEQSFEAKAGTNMRDYIFTKSLFLNTNNEAEGILCIITDITDLKQAHKFIMESKTKELTSSALRLIHLGEMNNSIVADLEKIMQHTDKEGSIIIKSIISKFGINSGEEIWQEFETRFENVYEDFYHKLIKQFPELTPGERKLCALLRLNLSSKDIATLTFQNPQSVDMARYRMRKKMNLAKDESLVDFLLKIDN